MLAAPLDRDEAGSFAIRALLRRMHSVTARRMAHSLKRAAAKVGGQELCNAARQTEKLGEAGDLKSIAAILPELERQLERLRPELIRFCE
jgi:HPt (histidine-containing phosphotransfer) domain-containing protein